MRSSRGSTDVLPDNQLEVADLLSIRNFYVLDSGAVNLLF